MTLTWIDSEIKSREFTVEKGEKLCLNLANFASFSDISIKIHMKKDASFFGYFADFSSGKGALNLDVYLEEEGASAIWRGAVIAAGESQKTINASLYHQAKNTEGLMSNYGIAEDHAKLVFSGTSAIANGAKGSSTRQEAKIIVFDPTSVGKASPILKIDENDVSASHAAIVGKLNDAHLFYLQTRGLPLEEARRLLTLGYLKPIVSYFEDEALKSRIDEAIERGL